MLALPIPRACDLADVGLSINYSIRPHVSGKPEPEINCRLSDVVSCDLINIYPRQKAALDAKETARSGVT